MALMTAEGTITRSELSLPNLNFGTSNVSGGAGIYIARNGFGPGDFSQRRITAQSPYSRGRVLVHTVADVQSSILKVRVQGSTQSDMYSKATELINAFLQFNYTLTLNVNGKKWIYKCETADYTWGEGGNHDDLMTRSNTQYITFSIPHSPVDTGSFAGTGTHPVIQ